MFEKSKNKPNKKFTTYLAPVRSDEKNVKSVTSKVLSTLGKKMIICIFPKNKTGHSQVAIPGARQKQQQKQDIVKVAIDTWCRAILVNSSLVPDLTKTGTDGLTTKNVSFQ